MALEDMALEDMALEDMALEDVALEDVALETPGPGSMTTNVRSSVKMKSLKIFFGVVFVLVLASNIRSMSHWNEARGVYDDVCYLRQAHLFQRFGLGGFDTEISRDDDHYFMSKLKEIDFPTANYLSNSPCHPPMASGKHVLQYPPGTGFLLALFPEGHQVVPLYVAASLVVLGFAMLGISLARTASTVVLAGAFGCVAMYLMINPAKASYSVAPTMAVCAAAGYLTSRFLIGAAPGRRVVTIVMVGLLLGLSVNFRVPNLLLSSGYVLFFLGAFLWTRTLETLLQGLWFGVAMLVGMAPTLLANAINAGSPLATTYGGQDLAPPELSFEVIRQYLVDTQFVLLLLAGAWTAWLLFVHREDGVRKVARVVAINLLVNLAFFLSHPIFTPYYTIPIAMLSLWTLLFASLTVPVEAVDHGIAEQAASVRS
jgi:hypothetical protein